MNLLIIIFFLSLLVGQLVSWTVRPGIVLYPHDIILVVLIIWAYASGAIEGARVKLLYPLYAFLFAGVVSLLLNLVQFGRLEILAGSLYLVRWFVYAELYVLIASARVAFPWLRLLFVVSVLFAIFGFIQYFFYPDLRNLQYLGWDPHYYRFFSTLLDPNFAGIILVLGFLLGLAMWQYRKVRPMLVMTQAALIGAILLTYSRSSYFAFLTSIVTFALVTKRTSLGLGLLVIFFVAIAVLPLRDVDILRIDRSETAVARLGNWERSMELIRESPVFGYGFNTLRFLQTKRGWISDTGIVSRAGAGVDNSFLFLVATTGIVGLVAYLSILNAMVFLGRERFKRDIAGAVLIASVVGVSTHALFINSLFYPWVMIWLWILVGSVERKSKVSDDR